jgi:hypothetical protein
MSRLLSFANAAVLTFIVVLALATPAQAQHDTRGKVFWVTFMSNEGSNGDIDSDLRLYLSSDVPTTARIVSFLTADTAIVDIPIARTTVEFNVSARFGPDVELQVFEEFSPKAIQVIADDEITCYGVNILSRSADAFLSLPDDAITNRYIVMAYPNAWLEFSSAPGGQWDMPSQFAVIGTEDGTTVRITPAARLNGRNKAEFTVTLDRGEVFNGQAVIGEYQDVSGTEIRSNKPVAVYGGTRRASVPLSVGNFRDHLVEQMPPLEVWGKEAVVTPHFTITPWVMDSAVYRVLAAFDNTRWQIDGVEQPPLMKAQVVERPLQGAHYITASDPILVAQYEHSSAYDELSVPYPGDPFMMLIPPTEQFFNSYSFQSVNHPEFDDDAHFVNVVIPTVATGTLMLDGSAVSASWQAVPKPGFSYAQIHVGPGSHRISADSAFGIYAYGFGPAVSYGYAGGMLFRTLVHDFEPPDIVQTVACGGANGFAFDSRITDGGIDSVYVLPEARNVAVTIDPFTPGADTVHYRASLVDPYSDGVVAVKTVDSSGRSRTQSNPIPGFTVRARGMGASAPLVVDTLRLFSRASSCATFTLENTGKFAQTITTLTMMPTVPGATIDATVPLTIAPGQSVQVNYCASGWADTTLVVSIDIGNACIDREVVTIPIITGVDTAAPRVTSSSLACSRDFVLSVAEAGTRFSQVAEVVFEELVNATITGQTPENGELPAAGVEVRLSAIDQYRDVIYQVRVVDLAGNVATYRDTIGGFTITAIDDARDSVSRRFDRDLRIESLDPGEQRCDSVTILNYGGRPVVLTSAWLSGNRVYSIPPAQFPFVIPPYSERRIAVCVNAIETTGLVRDTLMMTDACGREDAVLLRGVVSRLTATDGCDNSLSISSVGASKRTFLATPHPNPVTGSIATVDIGLAGDGLVSLELVDLGGNIATTVMQRVGLRAGLHRVSFDLSSLDNGTYFCRLRTAGGGQYVEKIVVQR